jgi:hypothetical protein
MADDSQTPEPFKFGMRAAAAVGIGLLMAAIWWQYGDQLIARFGDQFLGF